MKNPSFIRRLLPLAIVAALASPASAQAPAGSPAQQAQAYYRQGLAAEKSGDPAAARQAYTKALQANPNLADARYRLGQVKINATSISAKGREAKFGAVMVPEFKLDQATLKDALDALQLIVEKESKDEVAPNFVIQDPAGKLTDRRIDLVLKKTPARGVLKYVLDQAGAKARYDEYAIVITPN